MNKEKYDYDILLSFAGEDREIAESIAGQLEEKGVEVFYDKYNEADLWGKDLYEHLSKVYSEDGRYCIMLISEHYAKKAWTQHERKNAKARAFRENKEYILPVRLDDTKIPGIRDTVGYLDFREKGIGGIVNATLKKLDKEGEPLQNEERNMETHVSKPRMPDVRKRYSDRDKENYLYKCFDFINEYVEEGLQNLDQKHPNIETSFRQIHKTKFIGKIFKVGNQVQAFKIWVGGISSSDSICLQEGNISVDSDNSYNEIIHPEVRNNELRLKSTMGQMRYGEKAEISTHEDAASYLWERIISPLEI